MSILSQLLELQLYTEDAELSSYILQWFAVANTDLCSSTGEITYYLYN